MNLTISETILVEVKVYVAKSNVASLKTSDMVKLKVGDHTKYHKSQEL